MPTLLLFYTRTIVVDALEMGLKRRTQARGGLFVSATAEPGTRKGLRIPGSEGPGWARFIRRSLDRQRLSRWSIAILAIFGVYAVSLWIGNLGYYDLAYAGAIFPHLVNGLWISLELIALVIPLGFALGFFFGWARTTQSRFLNGLGATYVEIFRGMPPIALIFFSNLVAAISVAKLTGDPFIARGLSLWAGAVALAFHSGSYQAEIVRAGILSVPTGQLEAADAVGLSRWQSMFRVVLPQAFRVSLPALGNELSSVIKDTSLLNVIGWLDLSGIGLILVPQGLRTEGLVAPIYIWIEVAILYFVITFIVSRTVRTVENSFKVPGLEAAEL